MAASNVPVLRVVKKHELPEYPRCSKLLRCSARAFDLALAAALYLAGRRVGAGAVLAVLFLLFADAFLPAGQSLGKRLFGIRVVHLPTRSSARARESVLRNGPLALVVLLSMMPPPLGRSTFVFAAFVVMLSEGVKVLRDSARGQRWGDIWADTQVVDGKVPIDDALPAQSAVDASASGRLMKTSRRENRWTERRRTPCVSR